MKSVLIVEDEPAIRGLLSLTLEGEQYQVTTAEDGQEALDQVHQQRPDAILLDLYLPKVDGWQVIDSLEKDSTNGHIPIIAMSAAHRWFPVGEKDVRAYLSKPFDVETLLVTLDQVLGRETASAHH
jgi:CheY-like chemotaxis protein